MKHKSTILACFFCLVLWDTTQGAITQEQAEKLVMAAWKLPPESMDITYYQTIWDNTKDEQDIRKSYEDLFSQLYTKDSAGESRRKKTIEINVVQKLIETREGRKIKFRVRYDKDRQRIDKVEGSPSITIFEGTDKAETFPGKELHADSDYTETFIEVADISGVNRRYEYFHEEKICYEMAIQNRAKFSENSDVSKFMMFPSGISGLLKSKLGDRQNDGFIEPNGIKIAALSSGSLKGISVAIEADRESPDTNVKIDIYLLDKNDHPFMKTEMVSDKQDYSKVYTINMINLAANSPMLTEIREDFDIQGFPHKVTSIEYDRERNIRKRKEYRTESVRLNVPLSDNVFVIDSAQTYKIQNKESLAQIEDQKKIAEEIFKTKDTEQIKTLLTHPEWMIRMKSLGWLTQLLKDRPDELRAIAESMKEDKNPNIQKMVSDILAVEK